MRIGIDAKWFYSKSNPSGSVVIRNIVEGISKLQTDDVFYIFLNRDDIDKNFPFKQENLKLVYVWGKVNLLSNLFVLPYYVLKFQIECFLFQNYNSPFCKSKKIVYIHDVMYYTHPHFFTLKERLYLYPLIWLQYNCDQIITISENEKKRLVNLKFQNKDKITVVYHGINTKFKPKSFYNFDFIDSVVDKYSLPSNYILYVGRLNVRKNIIKLLEALPLLDDINIKLVIVGSPDTTSLNFNNVINELKLTDRVIMLGYTSFDHLPLIYSLAKVFCFPSLEEGFGMPPLEAMASNVPIAVSNASCMPEICSDAALYFDPDSSKDIALTLNKILNSEELRNQLSARGLLHTQKFNWDISVNKIYQKMKSL